MNFKKDGELKRGIFSHKTATKHEQAVLKVF